MLETGKKAFALPHMQPSCVPTYQAFSIRQASLSCGTPRRTLMCSRHTRLDWQYLLPRPDKSAVQPSTCGGVCVGGGAQAQRDAGKGAAMPWCWRGTCRFGVRVHLRRGSRTAVRPSTPAAVHTQAHKHGSPDRSVCKKPLLRCRRALHLPCLRIEKTNRSVVDGSLYSANSGPQQTSNVTYLHVHHQNTRGYSPFPLVSYETVIAPLSICAAER